MGIIGGRTLRLGVARMVSGALELPEFGMAGLAVAKAQWEALLALECMDGAVSPTAMILDSITRNRSNSDIYGRVNAP